MATATAAPVIDDSLRDLDWTPPGRTNLKGTCPDCMGNTTVPVKSRKKGEDDRKAGCTTCDSTGQVPNRPGTHPDDRPL